jgi:hypothetical protein
MSARIGIDRLSIALHGISREVAEAAVAGLDGELRRRLGGMIGRALNSGDLGVISIGPIAAPGTLDPGALRALIAERLIFALSQPTAETEEQE